MYLIRSASRAKPAPSLTSLDGARPESWTIVDDVAAITQALIVDDGDPRSRHWNDSARALLLGIILLTMTSRQRRAQPYYSPSNCSLSPIRRSFRLCARKPRAKVRETNSFMTTTSLRWKPCCGPWPGGRMPLTASSPPSAIAFSGPRTVSAEVCSRQPRRRPTFWIAFR